MAAEEVTALTPDTVFEGGDLDCGSGLILLIREQMQKTPEGGILELRSREPSVGDDLPPWCRMAGHDYLGRLDGDGYTRYFVRRGSGGQEQEQLRQDKEEAKSYEWRLRVRSTGHLKSTAYVRNFSFDIGQAASFEEKDQHPSGLEYLLGGLAGAITTSFASECARSHLEVDDIELSLTATLHNVLAHLGLEEGDPSLKLIEIKCFVSTFDDEETVQQVWQRTLSRSPLVATLIKATEMKMKLVIV